MLRFRNSLFLLVGTSAIEDLISLRNPSATLFSLNSKNGAYINQSMNNLIYEYFTVIKFKNYFEIYMIKNI